MNASYLLAPTLLACAAPALADVTVASPKPSGRVVSPFWLKANAGPCWSQDIASMGYSIDDSTNTAIVPGTAVEASVAASPGTHIVHVKSWSIFGVPCVTDVPITVISSPLESVPANATVSTELQVWTGWQAAYDEGTSGNSQGAMNLALDPTLSGVARQFAMTYSNAAGERYYLNFGTDSDPKNFLYDTWIYLASPSGDIANLEMDMNEVIPNGDTVIYGVQCDGYSNTWDYTANTGSRKNYVDTWVHSTAYCNPREWSPNAWHHVQITYSRNGAGHVTYQSIWLDGEEMDINATVPSAFALGWGPCLLTNFQIDGLGGYGSATVYLDHMTVYRW